MLLFEGGGELLFEGGFVGRGLHVCLREADVCGDGYMERNDLFDLVE